MVNGHGHLMGANKDQAEPHLCTCKICSKRKLAAKAETAGSDLDLARPGNVLQKDGKALAASMSDLNIYI